MFVPSENPLSEISAYCEKQNLMGSLANVSAFLMAHTQDVNWLGFYLYDGAKLVLGPFQGKPACTQIQLGKGVCGTAAVERKPLCVDNVDAFPGHIVCDSNSRSELVIPIIQNDKLVGVLDIDSPRLARFNQQDQIFYERVVESLVQHLDFGVRL